VAEETYRHTLQVWTAKHDVGWTTNTVETPEVRSGCKKAEKAGKKEEA
jgi:hypothetical protein